MGFVYPTPMRKRNDGVCTYLLLQSFDHSSHHSSSFFLSLPLINLSSKILLTGTWVRWKFKKSISSLDPKLHPELSTLGICFILPEIGSLDEYEICYMNVSDISSINKWCQLFWIYSCTPCFRVPLVLQFRRPIRLLRLTND